VRLGTGTGPFIRVPDVPVAGSISLDFPPAGPGGYTVLGSPTVIADIEVTGAADSAVLAARLLDVDENDMVQLLARAVYRPRASGSQVFQLHPMGSHVAEGHHLQLELFGNEAPTTRPSNLPSTLAIQTLDVRVPVAEAPDGNQIAAPAPKPVPAGFLPEPSALLSLVAGALVLRGLRRADLSRHPRRRAPGAFEDRIVGGSKPQTPHSDYRARSNRIFVSTRGASGSAPGAGGQKRQRETVATAASSKTPGGSARTTSTPRGRPSAPIA
jgi:hypothetical protein